MSNELYGSFEITKEELDEAEKNPKTFHERYLEYVKKKKWIADRLVEKNRIDYDNQRDASA